MAVANSSSIIRVPSSLIWNPTSLGGTPPYGGTYLGESRNTEFRSEQIIRPIFAEEWGSYADAIYCGEKVTVKATLRYPDQDAIVAIAPKSVVSGSSGAVWLFRPGGTTSNTRAGTPLFANAGVLLIAPRAYDNHPFVVLRKAVPSISEAALLKYSLKEEWGLEVTFYCVPDSNGKVYEQGLRANISL